MITDIWFYVAAVPAVFFYGMGKGGVGGILGMLSVPLIAMTISPLQAAAILLPLLCIMDVMALIYHRKHCNYRELKSMLPAATIGVIIASFFMGSLPSTTVEWIIGGLALAFLGQKFLVQKAPSNRPSQGYALSMLSGFASTIAHAGGPPATMHLLPKTLPKEEYIATSVVFFAALNGMKLIPYAYLGELNASNLTTSLVLIPIAFIGVRTGVWLVTIISQQWIYRISYLVLLVTGVKMLVSGIFGSL
ncbi:sulfite exporter TauE/SafE family protein [Marinomonas arenicola]|uniref:sulfite exporter TauE/SafE family protein n=1 Tax=Marinomonas arenicola TaxID=569601 RepID=UPI00311EE843